MVLVRLATAYSTALVTTPLYTKAATAALVAATGDAIAQASDDSAAYNSARGQSFTAFGAVYSGAWQHHLFDWLNAHCTGTWLPAAAECTLINQMCVVPLLYLPLFLLLSGRTRGLELPALVADARQRYMPLLLSNWRFWLPVQTMLFAFLSPELLVPACSLAGVVWNLILSTLLYRKPATATAWSHTNATRQRRRKRMGARVGGRWRHQLSAPIGADGDPVPELSVPMPSS